MSQGSAALAPASGSKHEDEFDLTQEIAGEIDSLRHTILSYAASRRFDTAIRELEAYRDIRKEAPHSFDRTEALFEACISNLEMMKRIFGTGDVGVLPMSKRHEIYTRAKHVFSDLSERLSRIEVVENNYRIQETRSTVWFLRSIVFSVFAGVLFVAGTEAVRTLVEPLDVISQDISDGFWTLIGF
ncbi:MAG: hypothetical protein K2X47_08995 [Bdellovibrionales bacterium]|nr:hypothetical protein [Bdellovibrionales bacterium]